MKLLYLCTANAARSIMAEAFTRSILPESAPVEVYSAGTAPAGIHDETIAVMKEAGVPMDAYVSKSIEQVPFDEMDLVVTLCDDARGACPAPPAGCRTIHWGLKDPAAETDPARVRESFRSTRDEVRTCVKRLMFELATDPANRRR